jgi:hypothetical protein
MGTKFGYKSIEVTTMADQETERLEDYIQDWYWDEESHQFARDIGAYLLRFMDYLHKLGLAERTVRKHTWNCWFIGILECQYGYKKEFSAGESFETPWAPYQYEFSRKSTDSKYALDSYKSTWKKLHEYTKALGLIV